MTHYSNAQFDDANVKHELFLCNYEEHKIQNEKIFNRTLPIDNIQKNILLDPRMVSTSKCNLERYNLDNYIFPPKTEILLKKNENIDEKYCHQNFANVDEESFLRNINKKATMFKEGNINQPVVDTDLNNDNYKNNLLEYYNSNLTNFKPNENTKRKLQNTLMYCKC